MNIKNNLPAWYNATPEMLATYDRCTELNCLYKTPDTQFRSFDHPGFKTIKQNYLKFKILVQCVLFFNQDLQDRDGQTVLRSYI